MSLRLLLLTLIGVGSAVGLLGRLYFQNPDLFRFVTSTLSTIVPFALATGTILWIGFRARRKGLIAWSIVLITMPLVGFGLLFLSQRYMSTSPGNLGALSNRRLIAERLPNDIDAPWVWNELERRLQIGELSQAEAEEAIGKLVAHMKANKPDGWDQPLSWQNDFVKAASQAELLSDEAMFALCDAFYGPRPVIQPLNRLRENSAGFDLQIRYGNTWSQHSGLDLQLVWEVKRVLLDGEPIDVKQFYKHSDQWSGHYDGSLPAGDHELSIEVECAYIDASKLIGLHPASLPMNRWPTSAKQWKQVVTQPFKVHANQASLVQLVTDPQRDPRRAGGIQVKRLVAQADQGDRVNIILKMELGPAGTPLSFDVSAILGDDTVELGQRWVVQEQNSTSSGGTGLQSQLDSLDPAIEIADLVLTPNPSAIEHRPDVSEIWGQQIILRGIPIERLDLESKRANKAP